MVVLVRWQSDSETITLRGGDLRSHPLLPEHLMLTGVEGASDPEHPDLLISSMAIRREDVIYLALGNPKPVEAPKPVEDATEGEKEQKDHT